MGAQRAGAAIASDGLSRRMDDGFTDEERELVALRRRVAELEAAAAEREHAIRALRESEERFRTILEHAPVMIDSFDSEGNLLIWNRELEKTLKVSREELLTMTEPLALFYPEPTECERVRRHIADADGVFREFRVRAKDGSTRIQRWANFRVPSTGTMIGVGYDVTDQRATEAQLRQAQRLESLGQLTGGIAHDFNNLLTVMLSCADLVDRRLPADRPELAAPLVELRTSARRGEELVKKLMELSRQEPRSFERVDVAKLVRDLAPTLRRLLPESIEIQLSSDMSLPLVDADPGALEQLLLNLVTNARDAMRGRGILCVETRAAHRPCDDNPLALANSSPERSVEPTRSFLVLSVRDTGSGMEAATRQRMFEPFFTTKQPGAGTGLGLAIVSGLVRQHHGFVEVQSEPERGTTVEVFLPVPEDATAPAERSSDERPRVTVLVVEDNAAIRRVARLALQDAGYAVLLAADGAEALRILDAHEGVELIISDIVLPGMSGPDLYRAVTKIGVPARFLFTSGYAGLEAAEGLDAPLLRKPWSVTDLLDSVERLMDR
jgi:PAS domain S-box-containing protein